MKMRNKKSIRLLFAAALVLTFLLFGATAANATSHPVTTEQELRDAIADSTIDTIIIEHGVTIPIEATIVIDRPLTLTGGGTLAVRQDGQRVLGWTGATHPGVGTPTAYFSTREWANNPTAPPLPTEGAVWLPRGGQTGAMLRIVSDDVTVSGITLVGWATTTSHNHVTGIHVREVNGVTLRDLTIRTEQSGNGKNNQPYFPTSGRNPGVSHQRYAPLAG